MELAVPPFALLSPSYPRLDTPRSDYEPQRSRDESVENFLNLSPLPILVRADLKGDI